MKKIKIVCFCAMQMGLVVATIHKHGLYVRELYREQRVDRSIKELTTKKQQALASLYAHKNPGSIKEFAINQLGMQPVSLTQLHKVGNL
jgi:hypothetical protein